MNTSKTTHVLTSGDYLSKAYTHYKNLKIYFGSDLSGGYWPCGCVFNSMIDFLNLAGPAGIVTYEEGRTFLKNVSQYYIDNSMQGAWYDDWCWWGNATAKIFDSQYSDLFGTYDNNKTLHDNFTTICTDTFKFMRTGEAPYYPLNPVYTGTTNAYDHVVEQAKTSNTWKEFEKEVEPMWNIGCWQGPMAPDLPGVSGFDPLIHSLGSFQDSVINGLVYIFVQRTLNKTGSNSYTLGTSDEVNNMTTFYKNWMSSAVHADNQIFNRLSPDAGLFRERVGVYKNGKSLLGFNTNLAWAGDQGLMLNALTQLYYSQTGTEQADTLALILSVVRGVMGNGLGSFGSITDVIMPWCNIGLTPAEQPGNAPGYSANPPNNGDDGDYFSGTGIFMRGLLEAISIPDVKQIVVDKFSVLTSTIAAQEDGAKYVERAYHINYNPGPKIFDEFNKMASYMVASQVV